MQISPPNIWPETSIKFDHVGTGGAAKLKYKINYHKGYEFPHLGKFGICSEIEYSLSESGRCFLDSFRSVWALGK